MTEQVIQTERVVFGGGCFWCTEAVFQRLRGVISVTPGYAGGQTDNPSYYQVVMKRTGHAEVIEVVYNPQVITFKDLLGVFFGSHDPTTLNRQGNDFGEMYRSVILYTTPEQRYQAQEFIENLAQEQVFDNPIVTAIESLTAFYEAEADHKNYYNQNIQNAYCQVVISPKLAKLRAQFAHLLKKEGE